MLDAVYQSVICFFMAYLFFLPAEPATGNGLDITDRERMGAYSANATIVVVNVYILLNSYRWDWLILLLVGISTLLIFFWTGVYSAFSVSGITFYEAGQEVFGQLSFWAVTLVIIVISLLPRFLIKAAQKVFFPYDIDIIREQVRMGKFDYLNDLEPGASPSKLSPSGSSDALKPSESGNGNRKSQPHGEVDEEMRPIYPPSVTQTLNTHNRGSANGSDGTEYTGHNRLSRPASIAELPERPSRPMSLEVPSRPLSLTRPLSIDRPRPSFDRMRTSMDQVRPSFEASNDFTSAARLMRVESGGDVDLTTSRTQRMSNLR